MNKIIILFTILLLPSFYLKSQETVNISRCNSDERHELKMADPEFASGYEAKVAITKKYLTDHSVNDKLPSCTSPLILPVAIHFQGVTIDSACLVQMALDQIEILNNDFTGTNSDISRWADAQASGFYPDINNGESCIQFCLVTTNHPEGYGLNDGDYAITINQTSGDFEGDWAGYLNFFVREIGGGILGYSPLGGVLTGDGITCGINNFGAISCGGNSLNSDYYSGRTITHMIGHYLFLQHPFNSGNCLEDGDGISDTPLTNTPTFGCPDFGTINCTNPVLWMTFMEYTDDPCLYMFSEGQVDHMEAYVNSNLSEFLLGSESDCFFEEPGLVSVEMTIQAFLQGPFNSDLELMQDQLRVNEYLPLSEPFTDFGFTHVAVGGQTISDNVLDIEGPEAVVDWIWVEIRDGDSPTEILSTKPTLIKRNGQIINVAGNEVLNFNLPESGSFLVALRNRNHLGFRTDIPLENSDEIIYEFNMTDDSQILYGTYPIIEVNGVRMMISGEANGDGQVNAVDLNLYWRPENAVPYSYLLNKADFNLDGVTNSVDRNSHWRVNVSREQHLD